MTYDILIKNGTIVDGSGLPSYQGDVAIKDGVISGVGKVSGDAKRVIDAKGLAVTPGFIDIHTHYDAQLLWDPLATSSCWHGVTTVLMGNCGFTVAPCHAGDRDYLMRMLARVEGMNLKTLQEGVTWQWETFPEFIKALDHHLGMNVLTQIGHSALRFYVMGHDSYKRTATPAEVKQMKALVVEAMDAGAYGFSTSLSPTHLDWNGAPVPSRLATNDEVLELAGALKGYPVGMVCLIPRIVVAKMNDEDKELLIRLSTESGRPVAWNGHNYRWDRPQQWRDEDVLMQEAEKRGASIFGIMKSQPSIREIDMKRNAHFDGMPAWFKINSLPLQERKQAFADQSLRPELRHQMEHQNETVSVKGLQFPKKRWETTYFKTAVLAKNKPLEGKSLTELSKLLGKHMADVVLDLTLEEDFNSVWEYRGVTPEEEKNVQELMRSPHTIIGISDGGAHIDRDCGAEWTTYLLGYWVREKKAMSLEQAIFQMTLKPARILGLTDRGLLRPGMKADVTVFDPQTVRPLKKEMVKGFPGGDTHMRQLSEGVKCTIVNGQVLIEDGKHTGAAPGRVIKSTEYNKLREREAARV